MAPQPPRSTLFPYTTLFRSLAEGRLIPPTRWKTSQSPEKTDRERADRKSTRLNSSHGSISYAVFCLKKKRLRVAMNTNESTKNNNLRSDCDVCSHLNANKAS